jgi:hypothetical protein
MLYIDERLGPLLADLFFTHFLWLATASTKAKPILATFEIQDEKDSLRDQICRRSRKEWGSKGHNVNQNLTKTPKSSRRVSLLV